MDEGGVYEILQYMKSSRSSSKVTAGDVCGYNLTSRFDFLSREYGAMSCRESRR